MAQNVISIKNYLFPYKFCWLLISNAGISFYNKILLKLIYSFRLLIVKLT